MSIVDLIKRFENFEFLIQKKEGKSNFKFSKTRIPT
jgi:hypothetical protein